MSRRSGSAAVLRSDLAEGMDDGTVDSESCAGTAWGDTYLVELRAECQEQIGRFVSIPTENSTEEIEE